MSHKLTFNQEKVYRFICDYIASHKLAPYQHEIQKACNIKSHKCVIDRLTALERKGYIKRKVNSHRGIRLANSAKFNPSEGIAALSPNTEVQT